MPIKKKHIVPPVAVERHLIPEPPNVQPMRVEGQPTYPLAAPPPSPPTALPHKQFVRRVPIRGEVR